MRGWSGWMVRLVCQRPGWVRGSWRVARVWVRRRDSRAASSSRWPCSRPRSRWSRVVGDVEVVGGPAAGQRDVAGFPGQRGGAVEQRDVDGGALGLVAGHGVAVVEVPLGPVGADGDLLLAVGGEGEGAGPGVDGGDGGSGAVEQAEVVVVGGDQDLVAGPVLPGLLAVPGGDRVGAEPARGEQPRAGWCR